MYTQTVCVIIIFPFCMLFKNSLTMSCIGDTNLRFENKFRSGLSSYLGFMLMFFS